MCDCTHLIKAEHKVIAEEKSPERLERITLISGRDMDILLQAMEMF